MSSSTSTTLGQGPRRVALSLAWLTGSLLLVGGLVTTYRVGMAVEDWPTTFGFSMFAYPLDEMIESGWGVTIEHSHRMLASTVGLLSLVLVLVTAARAHRSAAVLTGLAAAAEVMLVLDVLRVGTIGGPVQVALLATVAALLLASLLVADRRGPRAIANLIHLAIIGQGLLGGTRVLENSQDLAFVHGSAAQLVFLLIMMGVVLTSPTFEAARPSSSPAGRGLTTAAWVATGLVYLQIVLGAWLRHSGQTTPLIFHLALAFAAVGAVVGLARRLKTVAAEGGERAPLARLRVRLVVLLVVQIALGVASLVAILFLSGGFAGRVTLLEAVAASAHVLVGALLLGSCAATALWSGRLLRVDPEARNLPAVEGGVA